MSLRYNDKALVLTVNGATAGTALAGSAINLGDNSRLKVRNLTAYAQYTANTSTMTYTGKWQVSNDNSTWIDFANGTQNAAAVVLATGTVAAATKAIPAPDGVYGWRYARFVVTVGVATGGASDLLTIGYSYRTGPANLN